MVFPEQRTQRLLEQTNTLLAQLVAAQGVAPRTSGLALPPLPATGGQSARASGPGSLPVPVLTEAGVLGQLVQLYLTTGATGYATYVAAAAPTRVPARQTADWSYAVPPETVLIVTEPVTLSMDRHDPASTVTVLVDGTEVLSDWALTEDGTILIPAAAVMAQKLVVIWTNAGWRDVTATVHLTGVALTTLEYEETLRPLARALLAGVQTQPTGGVT